MRPTPPKNRDETDLNVKKITNEKGRANTEVKIRRNRAAETRSG